MPTKNYRSDLLAKLANPEYAANYLQAGLEEMLEDGDRIAFLLALKHVVDAKEAAQAYEDANIAHEGLQSQLNNTGNPTVETLVSVLKVAGLTLEFKPAYGKGCA